MAKPLIKLSKTVTVNNTTTERELVSARNAIFSEISQDIKMRRHNNDTSWEEGYWSNYKYQHGKEITQALHYGLGHLNTYRPEVVFDFNTIEFSNGYDIKLTKFHPFDESETTIEVKGISPELVLLEIIGNKLLVAFPSEKKDYASFIVELNDGISISSYKVVE